HITDDPCKTLASNWSTSTLLLQLDWDLLRVTTFNLSHMGLTRTIAPQVGNPSFIPHLFFTNCNFHGSLTNKLAYLGQLEVVK
ncbi:hypothetical protein CFP56_021324, partial [Quercus suber]